jgi:hypothetical protein
MATKKKFVEGRCSSVELLKMGEETAVGSERHLSKESERPKLEQKCAK